MALNRSVILEEIKSAGQMTVTQVHETLADKGIKVGTASVRRYLTAMSEEGVRKAQSAPLSNSLKRRAMHYQAIDI